MDSSPTMRGAPLLALLVLGTAVARSTPLRPAIGRRRAARRARPSTAATSVRLDALAPALQGHLLAPYVNSGS